jgi:hypothetical protein
MSHGIPLLAELTNCLSAYTETVDRVFTCIGDSSDPQQKGHVSPLITHIDELLSIDAELKGHLQRMEVWVERQKRIEALEAELMALSGRVTQFGRTLSSTQISLQGFLATATKLQKGLQERRRVTIAETLRIARMIAPSASGARRMLDPYPWQPSNDQMQMGVLIGDARDLKNPTVSSHSVSLDPVQTNRSAVLPVASSEGESSDE